MVVNSFQAIDYDGRFFVNPGSATGAWSSYLNGWAAMLFCSSACYISNNKPSSHPTIPSFSSDPTPSFALMDIQGPVVVTYVYQLIEGEVRVEKIEFRKDAEAQASREREAAAPRSTVMPQSIPSAAGAAQQSVW
jgi:vacuolar protein sorting-associated protein 29